MVKKAFKIGLAAVMAIIMSGCWDAVDIEDRDISTAVVVDYMDGQYSFYVEIASITSKVQNMRSEQGTAGGENTATIKASGKTLAEARINLDKVLNKPIFLGAVQALIITEGMAENGIEEYAYRVRQMVDYRKTMDVILTIDKPEDFLSVDPANESTVGFAIEDTLQSFFDQGSNFHMSLAELLEKLTCQNPCYLMPTLSVVNGQLSLAGYTVFREGYSQGFIPYDQSRGIVYIALDQDGGKPVFDYVVTLDNGTYTLETALKSLKITPGYENGTVSFHIAMEFKCIHLYPSTSDPITPQVEEAIRAGLKQQLLNDIMQTITLSQAYGCDYLSFSDSFRIRYPDIYKQMDWESEFKKAIFSISVDAEVGSPETVDYNPTGEGE